MDIRNINTFNCQPLHINPLTPNDTYWSRTAQLTSKFEFYIFIQQIEVLNILNMVYTLQFFSVQNAICFIILTYLVPVLFTVYIQGVLKLKKNNSGTKRLNIKGSLRTKIVIIFTFGATAPHGAGPHGGQGPLIYEVSRSHTQRRTTVGRVPLDE